jgi:hypothetical protein
LAKKGQSNPVKGISRYDSDEKRMHGWQARVQWDGDFVYKRFSDGVYGGSGEALIAAIEWRNEKEAELGKPRTEKWIRASGVSNGIEWHNPDREVER